ncbi:MAG: hypothetical protein HY706_15585 [Candidatus Hydrogenedentes bacterium]|nr:hypothetical protein [Candidatus Hydrogenedentota bacterium]
MAVIGTTDTNGGRLFLVYCSEPLQKLISADSPYDRIVLLAAVSVCPGAQTMGANYTHVPIPGDFGEEEYIFASEDTAANARALLAAGFACLPGTLDALSSHGVSPEAIEETRRALRAYIQEVTRREEGGKEDIVQRLERADRSIWMGGGGAPVPDRLSESVKAAVQWMQTEVGKRKRHAAIEHWTGILNDPKEKESVKQVVAECLLEISDLPQDIQEWARTFLPRWSKSAQVAPVEWNKTSRWERLRWGFLFGLMIGAFFAGMMAFVDRKEGHALSDFLYGTVILGGILGIISALISIVGKPEE